MMDEYLMTFFCVGIVWKRNEQRKKERNEEIPPLFTTKLGSFFFFDSCIYLVIYYICFDVNSTTLPWAVLVVLSRYFALFYLSFCLPWVR